MEEALYGASGGYYERGSAAIGRDGDFYTAPDATPAFGRTLAGQLAECFARLGEEACDIVELGAGKGFMAADILDALAEEHAPLYRRLTYWIVERSGAMRAAQARSLEAHAARVRWGPDIGAIRPDGIAGCVVSNEFYDALPVRVVTRRGGALLERRVGLAGQGGAGPDEGARGPGPFAWVDAPAEDPELIEYASRYGAAAQEGSIAEAGLAARDFAGRVARAVRRGFQLVIDYGERADRLYDARIRPAGTLLAYRRHQAVDDVLDRPGTQDLTAHVNFSAIEDASREAGMPGVGFTTQDRFLIALGLAERIAALAGSMEASAVRSRRAMMSLIHPEGMGRIFRVMILARDASADGLRGLQDPFAPAWTPRRPGEGAGS